MAPLTKAEWRRRAVVARSGLRIDHRCHCAAVATFLAGMDRSGWVVGYHAIEGEVDLTSLFERTGLGPFAVTRTPTEGGELTVHPLSSRHETHRYGFRQPVAGSPIVPDAEIAVVLVPGLAFDRRGGRLGRGRGYYDRFLGRLGPSTAFVGMTGGYIVAELPTDDDDVPMTHLCADFGVAPTPLDEPD